MFKDFKNPRIFRSWENPRKKTENVWLLEKKREKTREFFREKKRETREKKNEKKSFHRFAGRSKIKKILFFSDIAELSMHFVRPAKWKKYFGLIKSEKDASRTKVIEIFPYISSKLSKKKIRIKQMQF